MRFQASEIVVARLVLEIGAVHALAAQRVDLISDEARRDVGHRTGHARELVVRDDARLAEGAGLAERLTELTAEELRHRVGVEGGDRDAQRVPRLVHVEVAGDLA